MRNSTPRSRSGSPDDGLTPPQRRYEQPQYDQSDAQQQGMIDLARNAGRRDSNASSGSGPASNAESAAGGGNVAQAYLGRMLSIRQDFKSSKGSTSGMGQSGTARDMDRARMNATNSLRDGRDGKAADEQRLSAEMNEELHRGMVEANEQSELIQAMLLPGTVPRRENPLTLCLAGVCNLPSTRSTRPAR